MMYIIAAVLVVVWAVIYFAKLFVSGWVHILLAAAVVLILVQLFSRKDNGTVSSGGTPPSGGQPMR